MFHSQLLISFPTKRSVPEKGKRKLFENMNAAKVVSAIVTIRTVFSPKDQHDERCGLLDKVVSITAAWNLLDVGNRDWAVIASSNSTLYLCTV
jgi:hypothetical protein